MSRSAVVIPNWNGSEMISDCLSSLLAQTMPVHIIVVDNGSTDDSVSLIYRSFPEVQVVCLPKNLGFAGGVNAGIRVAMDKKFDYIALLNNDAIADRFWVEKLAGAADKHLDAGIITGKFLRLDKKHIDSAGEVFHRWGVPSPRGRNEEDNGQYDKFEEVFGATGGASLYKSELFKEIGIFDEEFFMYYEDTDISFRTQLAGWKVYYQPDAIAYHQVGASTGRVKGLHAYNTLKNQPMLIWKNVPGSLLIGCLWRFSFMYMINFAFMVRSGNGLPALRGLVAAVRLMPHSLYQRHKIQLTRKVSTKYIGQLMSHSLPPGLGKLKKLGAK